MPGGAVRIKGVSVRSGTKLQLTGVAVPSGNAETEDAWTHGAIAVAADASARAADRRAWFPGGMAHVNDPEVIRRLLTTPGRWAVVGLSENHARTAYSIAKYLQDELGMEIVPVHPKAQTVHGATGYATLGDVPGRIDVVDVFVRSELAGDVVDQAITIGAKAVWLQLGVVDEAAAGRARKAGLDVVMDTCPAMEAPRLGVG